jgi:hypothetical protein
MTTDAITDFSDPYGDIEAQMELEADYLLNYRGLGTVFLAVLVFIIGIQVFASGMLTSKLLSILFGFYVIIEFCKGLVSGIKAVSVEGNCLVIKYWMMYSKKIFFQDISSAFIRNIRGGNVAAIEGFKDWVLCTLVFPEGNIKIKLNHIKNAGKLLKAIVVRSNLKLTNRASSFVTYSK